MTAPEAWPGASDGWHADTDLLERYATGRLDDATSWSLEQHITGCDHCRAQLTSPTAGPELVPAARLDAVWARIEDRVDTPAPKPVERALGWVGVPDHVGRLLAATPALTVPWLLAVVLVLTSSAAAVRFTGAGPLLFLTVAPLVPLAGVALAFGRWSDPVYEVALAAPVRSGRLLLVRAAAVTATSFVLAAAAAVLLPGLGWLTVAWALPGLAVTVTMLALSTWWTPATSAGVVAIAWIVVVSLSEHVASTSLASFAAPGQIVAALLCGAGVVVLHTRRDTLEVGDPA